MRVKDAAEGVLACMLDHVGYFPPPCGPQNLSSCLDEKSLLQQCRNVDDKLTTEEVLKHFRYFSLDNSIILALLEQHVGNEQEPHPTVTALVRSPFGRHVWCIQLRHLPHHKVGSKPMFVNPGRPLPNKDVAFYHINKPSYFPDAVEKISLCKADESIPSFENISRADKQNSVKVIENQIAFEDSVKNEVNNQCTDFPNLDTDCQTPSVCQEFQTARLCLLHLGFLNPEALKESLTRPMPSLIKLDQDSEDFFSTLSHLDKTSSRTTDTVFILYVKKGQTSLHDVLQTGASDGNHPEFQEFLMSLGWPVEVNKLGKWASCASTIKNLNGKDPKSTLFDENVSIFNGKDKIIYWSDVSSELAFIVPRLDSLKESLKKKESELLFKKSDNIQYRETAPSQFSSPFGPRSHSLHIETNEEFSPGLGRSSGRRFGRQHSYANTNDMKVVVVWLENLDDYVSLPFADLSFIVSNGMDTPNLAYRSSYKDLFFIFIHPLQNGLFQIKLQGSAGKISFALPLIDGMLVSRRTLGTLVRETALNMLRRKRLDADSCQPPHVRRKLKIQDVICRYRKIISDPKFYTTLFYPFSMDQ